MILCVFVLLAGLVAGYAGQSAIAIGAPAQVSVSAAVVSSAGGIGSGQPVRVRLQIGVVNTGEAEVRVVGAGPGTLTTSVFGLSPAELAVPGGTSGELALDIAVACTWPSDLTLPALLLEEPNGEEQSLDVTGASALTEACGRGVPAFRPLRVDAVRAEGDQFAITVQSPTGRPVRIDQVRAGGVMLELATGDGTPVDGPSVAGGGRTTLRLEAPKTCPPEWLVGGLPSAVTADLADGASLTLLAGTAMPAWLLDTACSETSSGPGDSSVSSAAGAAS